jgi:Raf kinase inhibitor-like YbhB/YbcL family protein
MATPAAKFALSSAAFGDGKAIPTRHATKGVSGGQNVSLPLSWANLPEGTRSLAVDCIDRHPVANGWLHWLVINIPTSVKVLPEGASGTTMLPAGAKEGAREHVWDDGLGRSAANAWLGHASV